MTGQEPGRYVVGALRSEPVGQHLDRVGPTVAAAVGALEWGDWVGVVEIDPDLSDTAKTRIAYDLPATVLANCVVVAGKRAGDERVAACVVLADSRADVNNLVKRRLDVRKASFLPMDRAVELTSMEYGGITPIGLPRGWPVFVDSRVAAAPVVIIGSGIRATKLLVPGERLAAVPHAEVVEGLGLPAT
jgi:prolyl-tRNA editing enzyme YbaK/EbsC (Cys-tRNA(Pro) deacylase)